MARKVKGKTKLSYNGNLLVENRNGLIVNTEVFEANGTAERDAALVMLEQIPERSRWPGIRHGGLRGRVPQPQGYAARGSKSRATRWECG